MPHKLLLADDSVTIQRVIELTFADEDIQVITVGDGRQAIERIQAERPDIVLADVGMPERDGYEVAAFIKSDPELAWIPVLLLTGAFEPVDEERARAAGCDGVLAKPFEPQMVITRVKELLAGTAQRTPRPNEHLFQGLAARPDEERVAASGSHVDDNDETMVAAGHEFDEAIAEEAAPPPPAESVRIKRRPPIPVAPPAAPEPAEGLDDYFDRLDAAFATLNRVSAPSEPAPAAMASIRPGKPALSDYPSTDTGSGQSARDEEARFDYSYGSPAAAPPRQAAGQPRSSDDAPIDLESDRTAARFTQPAVADPASASDPVHSPVMAQAFSALLAAERGDPAPPIAPIMLGSAAMSEELIEQVVQRILERLTDRVVRETVADIVSNVAEKMVRSEIDRVKASLK